MSARARIFAAREGMIHLPLRVFCWTLTQDDRGAQPLPAFWTVQTAADSGSCDAPKRWQTGAIQRGSFTTLDREHTHKLYKLDADQLVLRDAETSQS